MPCTGDGSVGTLFRFPILANWARTRVLTPPNLMTPTSVTQLAAAVRGVETGGGVLRAMGSNWSYTEVALTRDVTHVIDTSSLANILNGTDATSPAATLLPFALNDDARANAGNLIHVEAGIKIHALNCALDALGKAMPTLGGSNGQSVAGVMGTGTHGSDVNLAPIADQVRAVHLVGPGGQEWWIEPAEGAITDLTRMERARDAGRLCSDIRIVYDTELFDAVLVSAGRMGVIYAVVVEVVNAFRLREDRERTTWNQARARIQTQILDAGEAYEGPRFMEMVLSPYADAAGEQTARP
ncbi:MAG: FAD-binding protein, partial [Myxococcaceae bacterium]